MRRAGIGTFAAICLGLTMVCGWTFHSHYLRHLDCFTETGTCLVPEEAITYSTNGFVWAPLAAVFAVLFLLALWRVSHSA